MGSCKRDVACYVVSSSQFAGICLLCCSRHWHHTSFLVIRAFTSTGRSKPPKMVATCNLTAESVVVVTGSSRGLGFEFVKQILESTKSHVVATARNPDKSDALTALAKQQPDRLKLVALDTGDESSIKGAPLSSNN